MKKRLSILGIIVALGVSSCTVANFKEKPNPYKVVSDATEYSLINSTNDLEAGKSYIITNGTEGEVKAIATDNNNNNRKTTTVTVTDSKITRGSSIMSFTLGGTSGAWTFATENYAGNAGYLASAASGSNNYLRVINDANTATIAFDGNEAVIHIGPHESRNQIRYNSSNLFACYSSGQYPIYLWKGIDSGVVETTYTVSYNSLGGSSFSATVVAEGGTVTNLPTPQKSNDTENKIRYRFDGWYTVEDENNIVFNENNKFTSSTEVNSNITLFAKYTEVHYNIATFNSNGGSAVSNLTVDVGELIEKPSDPHKSDYLFDGWFTDENCQLGNEFDFNSTIIDNDITLYAKWIDIPIESAGMFVKVTRTEDLVNGGKYLFVYQSKAFDGSLETLDAVSNTVDVTFDGDYILKNNNTKASYFIIDTNNGFIKSASSRFVGRTTYDNGLNSVYNPSPESNYQNIISFDGDGNVVVQRHLEEDKDVYLTYNKNDTQTRFRYYKTAQESIQLYKFVEGHTVSFITNSGSTIDPITVLDGNTIVLPTNPTKAPDSSNTYSFEGWYTDIGLTTPFISSTPITSDLNLYAKYTAEAIDSPNVYLDFVSSIKTINANVSSSNQNVTDSIVFADQNIANGAYIPDLLIGSVALTCEGPKYYDTGTNMRVYTNNTFTLSYSRNITNVVFHYSDGNGYNENFTADKGSFDGDGWVGEATSITFTNSGSAQVRITSIDVTYDKQLYSANTVVLRFGALIPVTSWESIVSKWGIDDYGVMFSTTTALNNRSVASIQDAFEGNAEKKSALYTISKGSGATPIQSEDDYLFTARLTIADDDHDTIFCAAPFIVVDGNYYFLEEMRYSVNSLAEECLTTHDSPLIDEVLTYLKTN